MKILLSNDDGYSAEGLLRLAAALSERHEVYMVAPAGERSGSGHALSFNHFQSEKINVSGLFAALGGEVDVPCHAVEGSPADAVKFAVQHIYCDTTFDAVISGINSELNVGSDIVYSGTFGAAQEGTLLGIPSVAVSTDARRGGYEDALRFTLTNLEKLLSTIPPMVTLNVNIPQKTENIKGIAVCPAGHRAYRDWYERQERGYKLKGYAVDCSSDEAENDCSYIDRGFITVTPVSVFATDGETLRRLRSTELEL